MYNSWAIDPQKRRRSTSTLSSQWFIFSLILIMIMIMSWQCNSVGLQMLRNNDWSFVLRVARSNLWRSHSNLAGGSEPQFTIAELDALLEVHFAKHENEFTDSLDRRVERNLEYRWKSTETVFPQLNLNDNNSFSNDSDIKFCSVSSLVWKLLVTLSSSSSSCLP